MPWSNHQQCQRRPCSTVLSEVKVPNRDISWVPTWSTRTSARNLDPSGFNLQWTSPLHSHLPISHFLSLPSWLNPITSCVSLYLYDDCPLFTISLLHSTCTNPRNTRIRKGLHRPNQCNSIHSESPIDWRQIFAIETLQVHFVYTLCFIHLSEFTGGIQCYKSFSSLSTFLPHIFNLSNLLTPPSSIYFTARPAHLTFLITNVKQR